MQYRIVSDNRTKVSTLIDLWREAFRSALDRDFVHPNPSYRCRSRLIRLGWDHVRKENGIPSSRSLYIHPIHWIERGADRELGGEELADESDIHRRVEVGPLWDQHSWNEAWYSGALNSWSNLSISSFPTFLIEVICCVDRGPGKIRFFVGLLLGSTGNLVEKREIFVKSNAWMATGVMIFQCSLQ